MGCFSMQPIVYRVNCLVTLGRVYRVYRGKQDLGC